jgi:anthranilate phosphoribosyltransferase
MKDKIQVTVDYQSELSQVLSRKAVGPKGSRHLVEEDLDIIIPALESDDVSIVSKAVLIASVIILEQNQLENDLLDMWRSWKYALSDELTRLFFGDDDSGFYKILKKILRGEDLNTIEASSAISYLLDDDIPDYQKGVFLIGERLKRESFEENSAFLQTMREAINVHQVDVPLLVDLADPYDGFRRYPIYTPFVASILAAMGIPAYCHGLQKVAPKYGNTIHKILDLAGKDPHKSAEAVAGDIEKDSVGWGYIDQSVYFPDMHDLLKLRDNIVKRPFLATLEKLLQPLRSYHTNFMVTGYVHSHYKQELADLLKNQKSLDGVFIVKGMEGTTQLDFRKKTENIVVNNGNRSVSEVEENQLNYPKEEWKECDSLAAYTLKTGIAALNGKRNTAREILINQAVQVVGSLDIIQPSKVSLKAQKVLDSGRAFRHWNNGCI